MPATLTVEQLRRERADHLAYLEGMLLEKPGRQVGNMRELRAQCAHLRADLEAQRERLVEQQQALEAQKARVEQQLQMVRRAG